MYLYVCFNIIGVVIAIYYGNPDPYSALRVEIMWPLLYLLLIGMITPDFWDKLQKYISYSLFFLIIVGCVASIKFNISGAFDDVFLNFESTVRPGYPIVAISGGGVVIFIFLYFYILSKYVMRLNSCRSIDKYSVFLGFLFILLTSRRAIFIDTGLAMLIINFILIKKKNYLGYEYHNFKKYSFVLTVVFILFISYLLYSGLFDYSEMEQFFYSAFENNDDDSRQLQAPALINGWLKRPIFGNGYGVNAKGWIANEDYQGAYELTYLALLFSKGLLGFLGFWGLCLALFNWVYKISIETPRYREGICLLIALLMILIANASNPYLNAFDFYWFLFIPLLIVNFNDCKK